MSSTRPDALERGAWAAALTGCALRFVGLTAPLGPQEIMGLRPSESPALAMIGRLAAYAEAADPPLFHLLLRAWRLAFGVSSFSVHFLTAALGVAGVGAAAWAARRVWDRRAAALTAAVAALHPYALAYSQEARSYALLIPLVFVSIGALARAAREDRERDWALFAAATSAAVWTHNVAAFVVAAVFLLLVGAALVGAWRPTRRAAAAFAFVAGSAAVWVPGALAQASSPVFPHDDPSLWEALTAVSGSSVSVEESMATWPRPGLITLLALALAAALASRCAAKERRVLAVVAGVGALSAAIPSLVSRVLPFYNPWRHAAATLPFVCLFWGAALAQARIPAARARAAALALAALFLGTDALYFRTPKTDYAEAVAVVRARAGSRPSLIVHPSVRRQFLEVIGLPSLPKASLCDGGELPRKVVVAILRRRARVEPTERCEWAVLREKYRRVDREASAGGGTIVTTWTLAESD